MNIVALSVSSMKYQVGVYTLGDDGYIPPKRKGNNSVFFMMTFNLILY